jgi:hypothetical protein
MLKHQSFMWKLHHEMVSYGRELVHYTGNDGRCRNCNAANEKLDHAYFNCPPVRSFWHRVETALTGSEFNNRLDFESAASLTFKPRRNIAQPTAIVSLVCAFWSIYRSRTKAWKEDTSTSTVQLFTMWRQWIIDIISAKYRTATKKGTHTIL